MQFLRRSFLKYSASTLAVGPFLLQNQIHAAIAGMGDEKFINVDGIRTRYFEGGRGQPMVLIHGGQFGMTSSAEGWRHAFGLLAQHFHVFAFDKLGMGYTDNPRQDDEWTMVATIRHAARFIETLDLEQIHLVGHSRGALPAARVALDHPSNVKNLILFDSNTLSPADPDTPADFYEKLLGSQPATPTIESLRQSAATDPNSYRKRVPTNEELERTLKLATLPKTRNAWEKMRVLHSRWVERNPDKIKEDPTLKFVLSPTPWWMREIKLDTLEKIKKGELKQPTLVIWGLNDPSAPYKLGVNLFTLIGAGSQRARFQVFSRCGHSPYSEYPEESARSMIDFIKKPEPEWWESVRT